MFQRPQTQVAPASFHTVDSQGGGAGPG
jgi:hypothetical protein